MQLRISRSGPLKGRIALPGDLHIGQQALVWAALAHGTSRLHNLAPRRDHALLAAALGALGARTSRVADGYEVAGVGLRGLRLPTGALDAGDSETTLALLVSLLAGQRFGTRVEASGRALESSLRTLVHPLRERGAHVAGKRGEDGDLHAPVAVAPLLEDELLESAEIAIPLGDPVTKLGLLISGLYARGVTAIQEGMLSRDHAERALLALGAPIQTAAGVTLLDLPSGPDARPLGWPGLSWTIPGDFTLATYVLAAALAIEGSDVTITGVGLNPTRTAWLEALGGTGARVAVQPKGDAAGGEPIGDVRAGGSRLSRLRVGGERAFRLADELPALAALALASRDRVSIRDVRFLRDRTPDALAATRDLLARFGLACTVFDDGIEIDPPPEPLCGAHVDASVPPAQALLACILGLQAEGETRVDGAERLEALYPGFLTTLASLGARIEGHEPP